MRYLHRNSSSAETLIYASGTLRLSLRCKIGLLGFHERAGCSTIGLHLQFSPILALFHLPRPIPERWKKSLPMVVLGVHMALKNDQHCSVVELVYGNTLCLPAEVFHSSGSNTIDQVSHVTNLKEATTQLRTFKRKCA